MCDTSPPPPVDDAFWRDLCSDKYNTSQLLRAGLALGNKMYTPWPIAMMTEVDVGFDFTKGHIWAGC